MRFGLFAVLALFLGAFAAHFILADRGYVLINFRGYVVEMSVPGLLLALAALYMLIRGAAALVKLPRRLKAGMAERRLRTAGARLTEAVIRLTEGDFARGERLLLKGVRGSEAPLVNYLLAARAAHLLGAPERRDRYLATAAEETPDAAVAIALTQAQLQLEAGDLPAARTALEGILKERPSHSQALGLLARVLHAQTDREHLAALLPRLSRASLEPPVLQSVAAEALRGALLGQNLTSEQLQTAWAALSAPLRAQPALQAIRAEALERLGRGAEAERELRAALKKSWHPALVTAYGEVRGEAPLKQLQQAEAWLAAHPEDGALLVTAARLCIANELWGKARSYLESSLALAPEPDAYALYGRLLTQLGEEERAALAFRSGLSLVSGVELGAPALIAPASRAAQPAAAEVEGPEAEAVSQLPAPERVS